MRPDFSIFADHGAKARDWNWHNVLGIWCALPLLVIALELEGFIALSRFRFCQVLATK